MAQQVDEEKQVEKAAVGATSSVILPIVGLKYYLIHQQSGKYVHPKGGSDNPDNDTTLVYYDGPGRLALQFIFETDDNDYSQIKQYSSGKYIHPKGGEVEKDKKLVLYDNSDGARTSINLVEIEGVTYLQHTDSEYYVHPKGGSADPDNDTSLVYYEGYRPGIAVTLLSAEDDITVKSVTFDTDNANLQPEEPLTAQTTITNNTDEDQESEATISYENSVTDTFELSFDKTLSFGVETTTTTSLTVPGIDSEVSMTFSFGMEFGSTETSSTSETAGVESSITVKPTVKANSTMTITVTTQRNSGTIPFTMELESSSGTTFTQTGTMQTEYFFEQSIVYAES